MNWNWHIIAALIIFIIGMVIASWLWLRYHPNRTRSLITAFITILITGVLVVPSLFPRPCAGSIPPTSDSPNCENGGLEIDGSTAMQPLISQAAEDYMGHCSNAIIQVKGGGSLQGLSDVESGTVQIANSDIPASSDYPGLDDHDVAVVIFVLIANKSLGVTNLTSSQIQNIYNGTYTQWNDPNLNRSSIPIEAIIRAANSGTRHTFEQYVLNGGTEKGTLVPADSTASVISEVESNSGAIGYVSLYDALQNSSEITILSIDGHPYTDYINNSYTFWNVEHMYTKEGKPLDKLTKAFIDYMGSPSVKQLFTTDSFIDINKQTDGLDSRC